MDASRERWISLMRSAAGPGTEPAIEGLPPAVLAGGGPDGVLWPAAAGATDRGLPAVDRVLAERPGGSLADPTRFSALEVWTECELSALHALARIVRLAPARHRSARLEELVAWHLEHTQPDNATNRPWAIHVFAARPEAEARLYAETMLHNVAASDARAEPLSRWILLDAVHELSLTGAGRRPIP